MQLVLKTPLNYRRLSENGTDMMLAFNEDPSADVTSLRLGRLHLLPMASQAYVEQYGLPNLGNVADQLFVDSDQYSSRSGLYGSWQDLVARGRVAHLCDTSMSYAMMVKCGLGIGLLSNYATIEPSLIPLDLNVHVQLQLHLVVLKERLRSRPVRLAFEFFGDLFSSENRWFGADVTFSHPFTGAPPREEPVLFDLRRVESD